MKKEPRDEKCKKKESNVALKRLETISFFKWIHENEPILKITTNSLPIDSMDASSMMESPWSPVLVPLMSHSASRKDATRTKRLPMTSRTTPPHHLDTYWMMASPTQMQAATSSTPYAPIRSLNLLHRM